MRWKGLGICLLPLAATAALAPQEQDSGAPSAEILVIGVRPAPVRIDYRLRGPTLAYCGPRDAKQDAEAVRDICERVRACVIQGARKHAAVAACVSPRAAPAP